MDWWPGRAAIGGALLASVLSVACSGGDFELPRPGPVPADAQLVRQNVELGGTASTGGADSRLFYSGTCTGGVVTLTTTKETVYAELSCDRFVPDSAIRRFLAAPVRIRIVPAKQNKLYVESDVGGTLEFTPARIWLESR